MCLKGLKANQFKGCKGLKWSNISKGVYMGLRGFKRSKGSAGQRGVKVKWLF